MSVFKIFTVKTIEKFLSLEISTFSLLYVLRYGIVETIKLSFSSSGMKLRRKRCLILVKMLKN